MKKVFLLFGIAAFSSASAQQKDLFDIQKHLQKKLTENKKAPEKKIIPLPYLRGANLVNSYANRIPETSYRLSNGDLVISGPGIMPCIKPDMSLFQTMPNAASGAKVWSFNYYPQRARPGQIPNGAAPGQLHFDRIIKPSMIGQAEIK